jgi:hypothetical protein
MEVAVVDNRGTRAEEGGELAGEEEVVGKRHMWDAVLSFFFDTTLGCRSGLGMIYA